MRIANQSHGKNTSSRVGPASLIEARKVRFHARELADGRPDAQFGACARIVLAHVPRHVPLSMEYIRASVINSRYAYLAIMRLSRSDKDDIEEMASLLPCALVNLARSRILLARR